MRGPRPQTPMLALSAALAFASSASSLLMPNPGSRKALLQPVMGHDAPNFADPSILTVDNVIYSFATSTEGVNVPVSCQSEGGGMELMRSPPSKSAAFEALPTLPKWSSGAVWAPDVIQLADGSFVMYFSAALLAPQESKHCIGAATSSNVTGPYQPQDSPLACPVTDGGAIDASGFTDSTGDLYVVYKVDGNSLSQKGPCGNADGEFPTPIMLQQVSPKDGFTLIGGPVQILDRDERDGPLVEAPYLVRTAGGLYVLFFSSNCYSTTLYDTSYATSGNLTGPYVKAPAPLLHTGMRGLKSPGGASVTRDGATMVWHADQTSGDASVRQMYMGDIRITGTKVQLTA